ncbi:MAG: hypothetical protein E7211_20550 [Clostridium lundense]|nr:hypothetical protein [Clostridium lundense]
MEEANLTKKEVTYTKEQILKSKMYKDRKDVLNVVLKENSSYTLKEVDNAIKMFMKREVK